MTNAIVRRLINELREGPRGQCYKWAYNEVVKNGGILVHAEVTAPFSEPPHRYDHAWVERDGTVYDWQTMEAGHGGKFRGKGYPIKTYYELYQPRDITRYDATEARIAAVSSGHSGPWESTTRNSTLDEAKNRRDRCMRCSKAPQVEVQWADGRGRAWFCKSCLKKWEGEEGGREVVRAQSTIDGEVPVKWKFDNKRSIAVSKGKVTGKLPEDITGLVGLPQPLGKIIRCSVCLGNGIDSGGQKCNSCPGTGASKRKRVSESVRRLLEIERLRRYSAVVRILPTSFWVAADHTETIRQAINLIIASLPSDKRGFFQPWYATEFEDTNRWYRKSQGWISHGEPLTDGEIWDVVDFVRENLTSNKADYKIKVYSEDGPDWRRAGPDAVYEFISESVNKNLEQEPVNMYAVGTKARQESRDLRVTHGIIEQIK